MQQTLVFQQKNNMCVFANYTIVLAKPPTEISNIEFLSLLGV